MKILDDLQGRGFPFKKKNANEYAGPCPFCGQGEDRFIINIRQGKERYWCRQCKKSGDYISILQELDSLTFEEAARRAGEEYKVSHPHGGNGGKPEKSQPKENPFISSKKTIIATYPYTNESGELQYEVVRYDPKDFRQRRPGKTKDYVWNLKGVRLYLYNLPDILERKGVFFVEGEKDVEELKRLGLPATTNPMGADKIEKQADEHDILAPLYGKLIYIIPDNDGPGERHAETIASKLYGHASTVKVIPLPGLPEKGDVSDFILDQGDDKARELLTDLAKHYPSWRPPSEFHEIDNIMSLEEDRFEPIIENGIMPYQSHILIAGESGVGKSLLRLELAIHLAKGYEWLGIFKIPRPRRVLICQWENPEITEKKRIITMCRGLGFPATELTNIRYLPRVKRYNLSLKGEREEMQAMVHRSGAEVIIYDCLSNMHTEKENDNVKMRMILDSLSDINSACGTSCILIHHFGKPNAENSVANKYRIRGAQSISDWAFTIAVYSEVPARKRVLRQLELTKVRDGFAPKKPYVFERDENFLLNQIDPFIECPPEKIVEMIEKTFNGEAPSIKALKEEIMEFLGCQPRTAHDFLKNAFDLEYIEKRRGKGNNFAVYVSK